MDDAKLIMSNPMNFAGRFPGELEEDHVFYSFRIGSHRERQLTPVAGRGRKFSLDVAVLPFLTLASGIFGCELVAHRTPIDKIGIPMQ
jgi:hypothetical protein